MLLPLPLSPLPQMCDVFGLHLTPVMMTCYVAWLGTEFKS